jgi:hypothetical protein
MKTITLQEFKEREKAQNNFLASMGAVNPYNFNQTHGIAPRGKHVRGYQKVKMEVNKGSVIRNCVRFIGHVIGYLKKRK